MYKTDPMYHVKKQFGLKMMELANALRCQVDEVTLDNYFDCLKDRPNILDALHHAKKRKFKRAFPSVPELIDVCKEIKPAPDNLLPERSESAPPASKEQRDRWKFINHATIHTKISPDRISKMQIEIPTNWHDEIQEMIPKQKENYFKSILEKTLVTS